MNHVASIGMWLRMLEQDCGGSSRAAAAKYGIDPGYWFRLRSGEKMHPSEETLQKLGLRISAVLYEKAP